MKQEKIGKFISQLRKERNISQKELAEKKEIVVANKMDGENFKENLKLFKEKYPNVKVFEISALNNQGLEELMNYFADLLKTIEKQDIYDEKDYESTVIYKFQNEKPYTITKDQDIWILKGKEIEKLFLMTRWEEEDAQLRFARKLKGMKVEEELERLGARRGDEVKILDYIFVFKE